MRRGLIIGSVIVSACLLVLGMWLGSSGLTKQSTQPKPKPAQVQVQKPKPIIPTQAQRQVPAPQAPVSPVPPVLVVVNVYTQQTPQQTSSTSPSTTYNRGFGWGNGSGMRWVPGYQRWVCEGPPSNTRCYWTWEPAHYE